MVISVNTKDTLNSSSPIFSPRKIIDRELYTNKKSWADEEYQKVQQGARNSLIKYGLPANEKHHQEQPKFQLTIPKGHNITNIAKYN